MAVDDTRAFHKKNLHDNKYHYTVFSRFTHGRAVNSVQKRGAKIHFNEIEMPKDEYSKLLGEDKDIG